MKSSASEGVHDVRTRVHAYVCMYTGCIRVRKTTGAYVLTKRSPAYVLGMGSNRNTYGRPRNSLVNLYSVAHKRKVRACAIPSCIAAIPEVT